MAIPGNESGRPVAADGEEIGGSFWQMDKAYESRCKAMSDADHVRAIRNAALAIQDAERTLEPLYDTYEAAIKAARAAGLRVDEPRTDTGDPLPQPKIVRETVL